MQHALVVIDGQTDPQQIVREAGELAAGVDASLTVLYITTEAEYKKKRETLSGYLERSDTHYTIDEATEGAKQFANQLCQEVLDKLDLDYVADAKFGNISDMALNYAERHAVDHIFLQARGRSPVGKAVFGDEAQEILLNFDGGTTVYTR